MAVIVPRDFDDDPYDPWYSTTAFIVKWVIVGAILIVFLTFIIGGYLHAQRRMKKGLAPLPYHRWMISRASRERFFPQTMPQNNFIYQNQSQQGQGYPMQPWAAPPPAYGESQGYVPPYPGAPEGSKVNPNQNQGFAPPPGPPPSAQNAPVATSVREINGQQSGQVQISDGTAGPSHGFHGTVETSK